MLKSKARCYSVLFKFSSLPCSKSHFNENKNYQMYVLNICAKRSPRYAVYSFLFFLPPPSPILCCVVCVKSTSNSPGRVLRLIWLLFHCTSLSYTHSTSNTSPVQASKNGTVCFCPACPFPVPGAGVYAGIFISKHMLDVLIPYDLIFASFW